MKMPLKTSDTKLYYNANWSFQFFTVLTWLLASTLPGESKPRKLNDVRSYSWTEFSSAVISLWSTLSCLFPSGFFPIGLHPQGVFCPRSFNYWVFFPPWIFFYGLFLPRSVLHYFFLILFFSTITFFHWGIPHKTFPQLLKRSHFSRKSLQFFPRQLANFITRGPFIYALYRKKNFLDFFSDSKAITRFTTYRCLT